MSSNTHSLIGHVQLPYVLAQDLIVLLSEHKTYLEEEHKKYAVCMNKTEMHTKSVLKAKIIILEDRIAKLSKQISKIEK